MSAPICPVHQAPMNAGKNGGWYCAKKDPSQANGWCTQRVATPKAAAAPQAVPGPMNSSISLTAAALLCAGQLYHQAGQAGESLVLDFVDRVIAQYGGRA